jgi:exodeoxyribonuclease-5
MGMLVYDELTRHQQDAVDICVEKIRSGSKLTKLNGYAGTGKTTLAGIIAERSGMEPKYAAYTGKAAFVLSRKGFPAQTIHSLLMRYEGKKRDKTGDEELVFSLDGGKASGLGGYLLVLDETSMIGQWLGERIMSIGIPVLAIGDPFQLPPVKDVPYFGGEPDAMLTEVVRHDGIVLSLATEIRENAKLYRDVLGKRVYDGLYSKASPLNRMGYLEFDQILVGRNDTRHAGNLRMRGLMGYGDTVVTGEKIMCLENNYRFGTYNGQQFKVLGSRRSGAFILARLDCQCNPDSWELICATCGWDMGREVPMWADEFTYTGNGVKRPDRTRSTRAMVATYGYVITVNKAQGSEWESVLVIDETDKMGGDHARWLYTAFTRSMSELAIING